MASLGDIATWVGVVASVLLSGQALSVSVRSLNEARRAADAAERAAEAAERQAVAAEMALPPPPPEVAWRIEHVNNAKYVLRNVGVKPASGVKIHTELVRARVVIDQPSDQPSDRPIPPNGSLSLMISGALGRPMPDELLVSWGGNSEGVLVAVPRGN